MDQKKIGNFLTRLRKSKGLTQRELGEKIGVTDKTVSRWETGLYMPDLDALLCLSELYNVTLNELLCGEHNEELSSKTQSNEVYRYMAGEHKRKLTAVIRLSVASLLCVLLLFLSIFAVLFINDRNRTLYPMGTTNEVLYDKTYMGSSEIIKNELGDVEHTDSVLGLQLSIPNGYQLRESGFFINGSNFIKISVVKEAEYAYPINLELSQYFIQTEIIRFVDRVKFAYSYDLTKTGIFSTENSIEIAAGCRILKSFTSIANSENQIGVFYTVCGDYKGYAISSSEENNTDNVWSICLQNQENLYFFTVKDAEITTMEQVAGLISTITFM